MDLGPTWPGYVMLFFTLVASVLLCRFAWRSMAPDQAHRSRTLSLWWLLAVTPTLVIVLLALYWSSLPAWLLTALSWLTPQIRDAGGDSMTARDLLVDIVSGTVRITLVLGLPFAAITATTRAVRTARARKPPRE